MCRCGASYTAAHAAVRRQRASRRGTTPIEGEVKIVCRNKGIENSRHIIDLGLPT